MYSSRNIRIYKHKKIEFPADSKKKKFGRTEIRTYQKLHSGLHLENRMSNQINIAYGFPVIVIGRDGRFKKNTC